MKRHPIDAFSLIAGLFVSGVAVAALARPWRLDVGPWVGPTLLVAAGVLVLGLAFAGDRSRRLPATEGPDGATVSDDPDRDAAVAAAYAELDDDVTLPADLDDDPLPPHHRDGGTVTEGDDTDHGPA